MRAAGKRRGIDGVDIASAAILSAMALLIAFPFYVSIITSFTTSISYVQKPVQLYPVSFTFENYAYVFKRLDILTGYRNTVIVVMAGTFLTMTISLMYAYALSMRDYPGKKLAFVFLLVTMYFSGGLIPTYLLIRDLKLINSLFAVILLCGVSPFNIIIIKNGVDQLPESLMEAARISGANEWQVFLRVVLPLLKPIVVTFSLFTAVGYWNEWYWSMITINKGSLRTLQMMLRAVTDNADAMELNLAGSDYVEAFSQGLKMATVMITMAPIMVVYPFLQKHFAKGILVGAIKM